MSDNLNTNQHITILDSSGKQVLIHFSELVESFNEGIYCTNADGILLFANQKFCKQLGYKITEVIGTSIFDFTYNEMYAKLVKSKLLLRKKGISDSYNLQLRSKSGEAVWVKLSGKPIVDSTGEFMGAVVICCDIQQQQLLEEELMQAKEDLESKVSIRTRQLLETNQKLNEQMKERRLAEISLKNSEIRFRDIYVNSPDAIYVESYDGMILDVNDATCKLHKTTSENLIGKTIYDIAPLNLHTLIRTRQPKIISGELTKFESECVAHTGQIIPIEISAAHIEFKGEPALLMHVRDISDRKVNENLLKNINSELEKKVAARTKELVELNTKLQDQIDSKEQMQSELQKQKDFFRLIIDATPNLIFVKDQAGKYLLANESVAKFYNMTTEQMEGHYDSDYNFTASDLDEFRQQDDIVLKANTEVRFPEQGYNNKETGKTLWLQTVKKPIPSVSSNQFNILGVSTNVTDIKEAKEELKLSEKLYRQIARNLPKAAIFIFDSELRYILAEGPLIGVISKPKIEIEGRTLGETIRESERESVEAIYRKILAGETSEMDQAFFGRQLKIHHIPIQNQHGEVKYGMVMVFDISDLKQIQIELEKRATLLQRSNEELERFAYVASHDLQGPLRTIASYLQLLDSRYKNNLDTEAREFIDYSISGAKRMQTLILDLLNYSRISSTPQPFVATDVNEVVQNVTKALQSTIQSTATEMIIEPLPRIDVDPNQLFQLFQNLIDNGIKFVKDKPPVIRISALELADAWQFTVQDNGIGIREEFRDKVFEIFQRLHTDLEYHGTGVGLAICKKIVEVNGGKIWFESEPNQGTAFKFTISKNKTD